jgi:hypothetical protein
MGAFSPLLSTLLIADFIAAYVLKMLAFSGVQCFEHPLTFRHCFYSTNFLNDFRHKKKFAPINQIAALLSTDLPNSSAYIVSNLLA